MKKLSNERIVEICEELKTLLFIVNPIKFEEDRKFDSKNKTLVVIENKEYNIKDFEEELNESFSDKE